MPELPVLTPIWRKHASRDRALLGLLPTVAILASVIVGIVNVRSLAENARLVSRSHEVIAGARDLLSIVKDAETGQRGVPAQRR
jgi:CHASE3 domain sensor protein